MSELNIPNTLPRQPLKAIAAPKKFEPPKEPVSEGKKLFWSGTRPNPFFESTVLGGVSFVSFSCFGNESVGDEGVDEQAVMPTLPYAQGHICPGSIQPLSDLQIEKIRWMADRIFLRPGFPYVQEISLVPAAELALAKKILENPTFEADKGNLWEWNLVQLYKNMEPTELRRQIGNPGIQQQIQFKRDGDIPISTMVYMVEVPSDIKEDKGGEWRKWRPFGVNALRNETLPRAMRDFTEQEKASYIEHVNAMKSKRDYDSKIEAEGALVAGDPLPMNDKLPTSVTTPWPRWLTFKFRENI